MAARARSAWHKWGARGLVPILALAMVVVFVGTAQAVHDTGFFQLDGNVAVGDHGVYPNAREDWDVICAAHLGSGATRTPGQTCQKSPTYTLPSLTPLTVSDRSAFIQDGSNTDADNIYKGGTDDADLNTWQWKTAKPSPPKDDLLNAFAAEYQCDSTATTNGYCTLPYQPTNDLPNGHKILFFGGDRFANNGNTNIGFWFLRKGLSTGTTTCGSQSGCNFVGPNNTVPSHTVGNCSLPTHPTPCTPGDLFVFSAFLIGGSQPNIQVYEWVGAGNATNSPTSAKTLQLVASSGNTDTTNAACDSSGLNTGDKYCALVNQSTLNSPWLFTAANGKLAANTIDQFELFEGGIDLTQLGFGGTCISTLLVNTRSSGSSVNSVAQDFTLGSFGSCTSSITTTAGLNAAGTSIATTPASANGTASSGTDSATVGVQGLSQWGGTVDFYLCGPIGTTAKCDSGGVKLNGTTGNVGVTVSNSTPTVGSGSATLTSAGRYCWYSTFTPDTATAAAGVDGKADGGTAGTAPEGASDSNSECFVVSPVTPTITTQAGSSPVSFGSAVTDVATLSGAAKEPGGDGSNTTYPTINATNGAFAGTIDFTLKGPDPDASTTNCTDNATAYTGETQTFPISKTVTGNTTYNVSFTPGSPGKYHWVATYNGPGAGGTAVNNVLPQTYNGSCTDGAEDVVVQQIGTSVATVQDWLPNDTATVQADQAGGNTLQGTITFTLYPNADCNGTETDTALYTKTFGTSAAPLVAVNGKITQSSDNTKTIKAADNISTVSWLVTFTPVNDPSHTGSTNSCDEQSNLTITDSP